MTKYRIIYLIIYLGAIAFAFAYESKLTLTLMITAMALPILSFLLLLISRLLLRVRVTPDIVFAQKRQGFAVDLKIKNRFIIPLSPVKVTGGYYSEKSGFSHEWAVILGIMPFSEEVIDFSGNISYRGEYAIGIKNIEIYDFFRIFRFNIKCKPACNAVIAPRRLSIDGNNLLSADDNESTRTVISFVNNNTFASTRKYIAGDSLSRVHWKLSAKQTDNELIVKQMEQSLGTNAVMITDTRGVGADEIENMKEADAVIESALALTRRFVSDNRRAENIYRNKDGEYVIKPCEKQDDYEAFFIESATLPVSDSALGVTDIADRFRNVISRAEILIIFTSAMNKDELSLILSLISSGGRAVRVYTPTDSVFNELSAYSVTVSGVTVFRIDPDDVVLSLRNSMR